MSIFNHVKQQVKTAKQEKKTPRPVVIVAIIVVLAAAGSGLAYWMQRSPQAANNDTHKSQAGDEQADEEAGNEGSVHETSEMEEYKKLMNDESLPKEERTAAYMNAAFLGARVGDPEAAKYAQQALDMMPEEMINDQQSQELVKDLRAIAAGDYSSFRPESESDTHED